VDAVPPGCSVVMALMMFHCDMVHRQTAMQLLTINRWVAEIDGSNYNDVRCT
jgi:hypothetical protein